MLGVSAYRWVRAKAGAEARGIEGATALDDPLVVAFSNDLHRHPDYVDPKRKPRRGQYLIEVDVNGHYHASAGIELGHGTPTLIHRPRDIDGYLKDPGYIRLAGDLVTKHPAWQGVRRGRVLATTTAKWLLKNGFELPAAEEVLTWTEHRRHLDTWYTLFRDARIVLIQRKLSGNRAAGVALDMLKATVTTTLGGWLRSEERTIPNWCAGIGPTRSWPRPGCGKWSP